MLFVAKEDFDVAHTIHEWGGIIPTMTYQVEIIETLSRIVKVEAVSEEDAERLVRDRYRAGEIVLGGDDCVERSMRAISVQGSE